MKRPDTFQEIEAVTNADAIQQISCSEALRNRGKTFCLFTPALLITHGGFDRDPVQEFDARYNLPPDYRPFCIQLRKDDERFFDGLGVVQIPGHPKVNWDQRLYAIDEEYAGDCFEFIGGIAFSDPKRGFFANVMSYDLVIPDPTSRRREFLTVKIFGVLANTFVAYMQDRSPWRPLARNIGVTRGMLPADVPRTNFLGGMPKGDLLQFREGD